MKLLFMLMLSTTIYCQTLPAFDNEEGFSLVYQRSDNLGEDFIMVICKTESIADSLRSLIYPLESVGDISYHTRAGTDIKIKPKLWYGLDYCVDEVAKAIYKGE